MAAFLLDSSLLEEPNNNNNNLNFSHFYQPENLQKITANVCVHGNGSCLDQYCNDDHHQPSVAVVAVVTNKTSITTTDSSSITDKVDESGEQVSQMVAPVDKIRKNKRGCSMNSAQSKNVREVKGKKQKKSNDVMKTVEDKKDDKKGCEEAPTGYIHVRARRGQATDSHSLAERVRREKISERMKILQALVPGCDKVTGKALMLDEIINYVQSLQHQVEFLSMKLASVNPMLYDFGVDLDAVMVRNEQRLNALTSPPLPPPPPPSIMQPCNPPQPSVTSDPINALPTPNNYTIQETSPSLLFQQGYFPNTLPQVNNNGQVWWDNIDEQRQKLMNQCVFTNNLPLM